MVLIQDAVTCGRFGDALAEADWIVGNVVEELTAMSIMENTLILFTGDNGYGNWGHGN